MIAALKDYEKFLQDRLLPRSNGDFRLGAENYAKKLPYEEMVDIPLDRLLEIGYDDLHANQQKFTRDRGEDRSEEDAAADSGRARKGPSGARTSCSTPSATDASKLRDFIIAKKIITIPSPVLPILEETPPFMRALTFASMDTPGPYEKVAKEAFFNVTLPEKDWTPERVEDFMRQLQPRHHPEHRDSRSLSRPLRAVPVDAARRFEGAQAAGRQFERRRLGALLRADDARRRLLAAIRACAWASCRTRCCATRATSSASRCTPASAPCEQGVEFFEKEGYQPHEVGGARDQARHLRSDVSVLHARQAANPEAARGLSQNEGRAVLAGGISRQRSCSRASRPSRSCGGRCWATIRRPRYFTLSSEPCAVRKSS